LILTDPPYNLSPYSTGNIKLSWRKELNNDLADWDKKEFVPKDWVNEFKRILKPTGNIFAFTVRHLLPLGDIKDTQNGFKLFTAESATKIFRHQSIYYWAFDVEILTLAKAFGYKIVEVPIVWVNDERSKMNLKGMMRMAFEVFLIRLHFFTFDYSKLGDTPAKRLPPSK